MARSSWRSGRPTPTVRTSIASSRERHQQRRLPQEALARLQRALLERGDLRIDLLVALLRDALDERA